MRASILLFGPMRSEVEAETEERLRIEAGHGKTIHIVAHSMGGLVSRYFIENLGGHEIVQHLIMLGTPNSGSPWPEVQRGNDDGGGVDD